MYFSLFLFTRFYYLYLLLKQFPNLTPGEFLMFQLNINTLKIEKLYIYILKKFYENDNIDNYAVNFVLEKIKKILKRKYKIEKIEIKIGIALDNCELFSKILTNHFSDKSHSSLLNVLADLLDGYYNLNKFFYSGNKFRPKIISYISSFLKDKPKLIDFKFKFFYNFDDYINYLDNFYILKKKSRNYLKNIFEFFLKDTRLGFCFKFFEEFLIKIENEKEIISEETEKKILKEIFENHLKKSISDIKNSIINCKLDIIKEKISKLDFLIFFNDKKNPNLKIDLIEDNIGFLKNINQFSENDYVIKENFVKIAIMEYINEKKKIINDSNFFIDLKEKENYFKQKKKKIFKKFILSNFIKKFNGCNVAEILNILNVKKEVINEFSEKNKEKYYSILQNKNSITKENNYLNESIFKIENYGDLFEFKKYLKKKNFNDDIENIEKDNNLINDEKILKILLNQDCEFLFYPENFLNMVGLYFTINSKIITFDFSLNYELFYPVPNKFYSSKKDEKKDWEKFLKKKKIFEMNEKKKKILFEKKILIKFFMKIFSSDKDKKDFIDEDGYLNIFIDEKRLNLFLNENYLEIFKNWEIFSKLKPEENENRYDYPKTKIIKKIVSSNFIIDLKNKIKNETIIEKIEKN
jgi:hypothetical protein